MPFVGDIFSQLKTASEHPVLQEIRDGRITAVTGSEFLELIRKARTFLASKGLQKGDRCGLLASNSMRWMAMDLAATADFFVLSSSSGGTGCHDERQHAIAGLL